MSCGSYNGRKVIDLAAKVAKKVKARKAAAAKK
jgi:hypothetical protein